MSFKETSLGDTFGGLLDAAVTVAKEVGDYDIRKRETKSAATAQYGNDQTPEAVNTNGAPVQHQREVLGVKTSTIMYVGLFAATIGGAYFLATQAKG